MWCAMRAYSNDISAAGKSDSPEPVPADETSEA